MRFPLRSAFGLVLLSAVATAQAGTGVRNGGSYYRCEQNGGEIVVVEHMLAQRGLVVARLEDREEFLAAVLEKIEDPTFRRLLVERWRAYGDSAAWPAGELSEEIQVYSYLPARAPRLYGSTGRIPPQDPADPICAFPAYDPDRCCEKVLASYFGRDDARPWTLPANFSALDRFQRNILELHEAVYRLAHELGRLPPPPLAHRQELDAYLASPWRTGELPAEIVESAIIPLLSADVERGRFEFAVMLARLWNWSSAIYGSPSFR